MAKSRRDEEGEGEGEAGYKSFGPSPPPSWFSFPRSSATPASTVQSTATATAPHLIPRAAAVPLPIYHHFSYCLRLSCPGPTALDRQPSDQTTKKKVRRVTNCVLVASGPWASTVPGEPTPPFRRDESEEESKEDGVVVVGDSRTRREGTLVPKGCVWPCPHFTHLG